MNAPSITTRRSHSPLPTVLVAMAVMLGGVPAKAETLLIADRRNSVRREFREGLREIRSERREAFREIMRADSPRELRREIREGIREIGQERREMRREIRRELRRSPYYRSRVYYW